MNMLRRSLPSRSSVDQVLKEGFTTNLAAISLGRLI